MVFDRPLECDRIDSDGDSGARMLSNLLHEDPSVIASSWIGRLPLLVLALLVERGASWLASSSGGSSALDLADQLVCEYAVSQQQRNEVRPKNIWEPTLSTILEEDEDDNDIHAPVEEPPPPQAIEARSWRRRLPEWVQSLARHAWIEAEILAYSKQTKWDILDAVSRLPLGLR